MNTDNRILNLKENVKQLSDKLLLEQTNYIAEHEREVTILALRHLREVEIRRLYVELGYSSMYAYCIKHLKYSENKTMSRLSSARLMTELPEIEKQIEDGSLNVTTLSKVQSFVRAEKLAQQELSKDQKLALIADCENKPTRELAKELIKKSHQPGLLAEKFQMTSVVLKDSSLDLEYTKFAALLDSDSQKLLQEFKDLYAHDLPDGSNITVINFLLKKVVNEKKKKLGLPKKSNIDAYNNAPPPISPKVTENSHQATIPPGKDLKPQAQRKPLPVATKRSIWNRAQACCEHVDPKMKIRCRSTFALQEDHIIPVAVGGTNDVDNMQLLCRVHNSRRAIKTFGVLRR